MIDYFSLDDIVEENKDIFCIFSNSDKFYKVNLLDVVNDLSKFNDVNKFNDINKLIGNTFIIYQNNDRIRVFDLNINI